MDYHIFTLIFEKINGLQSEIGQGLTNVSGIVMPVFSAIFGAYVLMVLINYWQGSSLEGSFLDLIKRFSAWAIILAFGVNISYYTTNVMPHITTLGNDLGNAWNSTDGKTAHSGLDDILGKLADTTGQIMSNAINGTLPNPDGTTTTPDPNTPSSTSPTTTTNPALPQTPEQIEAENDQGILDTLKNVGESINSMGSAIIESTAKTIMTVIMAFLLCCLLWIGGILFLVIAGADLFIAQTVLLLLSAVAPIFFAFGLFPATRNYMMAWINAVLSNSFLFLFVTILANFAIKLLSEQMQTFASSMGAVAEGAVAGAGMASNPAVGVGAGAGTAMAQQSPTLFSSALVMVCMFCVFAVVLQQLPSLAGSLFGGFAGGGHGTGLSQMGKVAGGMRGVGQTAGKAGGRTAQAFTSFIPTKTNKMKA